MSTATAATPVKPARKFPPPCWTKEEAVALIDAYRERWFALHRGCLRTADWDAVAAVVTSNCPDASPAKTSAQCRHKMEKLRQRYRAEKQRALSFPGDFLSNWFYFENMNFMELASPAVGSDQNAANRVSSGGGVLIKSVTGRNLEPTNSKRTHQEKSNLNPEFRPDPLNIRYPRPAHPAPAYMDDGSDEEDVEDESDIEERFVPPVYNGKRFGKFQPQFESVHGGTNGYGMRNSSSSRGGGKRERDPIAEMVSSINMLGEGFVKMEKMKMEMNREIEKMRIEMDMKRNAMVLELQQQVVDAFVTVLSEKKQRKKAKMEVSPES